MRREKLEVLLKEFPFLGEIIQKTKWDWKKGTIQISRMDANFLREIPVDESYDSSAGRSEKYERLFAVRNGEVEEIEIIPAIDHSSGYAYDKPVQTEGQTFLSVLRSEKPFDFLVRFQHSYCSWQNGEDYDILTILKPSKHTSIREEWAKALAEARREVYKEADV